MDMVLLLTFVASHTMDCSLHGLHASSSSPAFRGFAPFEPLNVHRRLLSSPHSPRCIVFVSAKTLVDAPRKQPASSELVSKKHDGKRPKLLRTWNEGVRVLSGQKIKEVKRKDEVGKLDWKERPGIGTDATSSFRLESGSGSHGSVNETKEDLRKGFADDERLTHISTSELDCQHFSRCSGCILEDALDHPPVFKDAVSFFRGYGIRDLSLTTGNMWEWRCRAKLAVQGTMQNPLIGLYQEGTHIVVDIPACRAHHPCINAAIELLKEGIRELGVQPYMEDSGQGELRYVQMAITTYNTSISTADRYANGKVQVTLVWNARSEQSSSGPLLRSIAEFLWQKGGPKSANPILHSIWVNFQTSRTNVIFGGRWRHLLGEQQCWEHVGGVDICLMPFSFAQANLQAFEVLLRRLQKHVMPGSAVVELYAGIGVIGLSLAVTRSCRTVKCVEVNKEARTSFELSLSRFPRSNKSNISWHCADVSVSPVNWLRGSDVVVVDPPRKGLDASVIEALRTASLRGQGKSRSPSVERVEKIEKRPWILRMKQACVQKSSTVSMDEELEWPKKLIYVSCGWQAFKLDCAALSVDNAWHLKAVEVFNLFPGTDSIEVLAVFKAGKKQKTLKKRKTKVKV